MLKKKVFAVIGCGLGGATMAALLQKHGYSVKVFEQAKTFSPIGAGIHITPNAMKVIRHLGLELDLLNLAYCPSAFTSRDWDTGNILFRLPLGGDVRDMYDASYITVHRRNFHKVLISAIKPEAIHFGKRLIDLSQSADGVRLFFEDGSQFNADFLIGADGLSSVVRQILVGACPPIFSGQVAFRSIIPANQLKTKPLDDLTKWWAPDRFIITYYLTRSKDLFYFVAGFPAGSWESQESSLPGEFHELIKGFKGFHPAVQDILQCSTQQRLWPIFERPSLSVWHEKRVVLLGDACHPMRPHMVQGAAMAIEDAAILIRCLEMAAGDDWEAAFKNYYTTRIRRTTSMQTQSAQNDWLKYPMDPAWIFSYDALKEPIIPAA